MSNAKIAIIMGSKSDLDTMNNATLILKDLDIEYDIKVVSAHRTPERLYEFSKNAINNGYKAIIAGAGGSAHLPGMVAALTTLPVIAVPVKSKALNGVDSLLSIVQMPKGIAVATQAIGEAGAFNAGLMAVQMLAINDQELQIRLQNWKQRQTDSVSMEIN